MSKHTPGPWEVHPLAPLSVHQPEFECWIPQNKADARLIAAAPDLLAALKEALSAMESDWHRIDGEWGPTMSEFGDLESAVSEYHWSAIAIGIARAAIAKAEEA